MQRSINNKTAQRQMERGVCSVPSNRAREQVSCAKRSETNLSPFTSHFSPARKRAAFTLAEVLITLGIIGVVAAITLPSVINKYWEKAMVTRVKTGHALLQNAAKMYMYQNSCEDLLCLFDKTKSTKEITEDFAKMFKGAKVCTTNTGNCKSYGIKNNIPTTKRDGKYVAGDSFKNSRILLPNGIAYAITSYTSCPREVTSQKGDEYGYLIEGEYYTSVKHYCGIIYMDVNNSIGPNQFGVDVYRYDINDDGSFKSFHQNLLNNALIYNKLEYTKYNLGDDVK